MMSEENNIAVQVDASSFRTSMSSMMKGAFGFMTQIERQVDQLKVDGGGMAEVRPDSVPRTLTARSH